MNSRVSYSLQLVDSWIAAGSAWGAVREETKVDLRYTSQRQSKIYMKLFFPQSHTVTEWGNTTPNKMVLLSSGIKLWRVNMKWCGVSVGLTLCASENQMSDLRFQNSIASSLLDIGVHTFQHYVFIDYTPHYLLTVCTFQHLRLHISDYTSQYTVTTVSISTASLTTNFSTASLATNLNSTSVATHLNSSSAATHLSTRTLNKHFSTALCKLLVCHTKKSWCKGQGSFFLDYSKLEIGLPCDREKTVSSLWMLIPLVWKSMFSSKKPSYNLVYTFTNMWYYYLRPCHHINT